MDTRTLRKKINSAFEPFAPASPETYVDCAAVRGNWAVTSELGYNIVNSDGYTCQLFSGHRGSGKSTELLRSLTEYVDMVYSPIESDLRENYGSSLVLPMLMVRFSDGRIDPVGLGVLRQVVSKRINAIDPDLVSNLDNIQPTGNFPAIFASPADLNTLCLMSGGRVRVLMHLIQTALRYHQGDFPITELAVSRAIQELGNNYSNEVLESQWPLIARIASQRKTNVNNSDCLELMRRGHLLEYRHFSEDNKLTVWRDIHPLLANTERFHEAIQQLGGNAL
jgi:hypothetical protein